MGDQFGKDPVFRWAEERAVNAHATKDDQWKDAAGGIPPERERSGGHEEDLDDFDRDDDRPFTDAIGQCASDKRQEHQRQRENHERYGRLRLGDGLQFRTLGHAGGGLPNGQQGHHQLPGIVVECPAELRNQEAAKRIGHRLSLRTGKGGHPCGVLCLIQKAEGIGFLPEPCAEQA